MFNVMFSVSYESLGGILEQLQQSPEIKNSPELADRVHNAILFHQQISVELQGLLSEFRELEEKVSELTRESGERVCNQPARNRLVKYEELHAHGASPQDVYQAARNDGFDDIESIRVLRRVFQLSLSQAQETASQAEVELQRRPK